MLEHFDSRLTLKTVRHTVESGYDREVETASREVWGDEKSVGRDEFYKAAAAGVRTDVVFAVNALDYSGETRLSAEGKEYDVIRAYQKSLDRVELTCRRRDGLDDS